jgi:DNA-binding transcriptional LysR family regulator
MVLVAPPKHALARIARHHPVQPAQLEGIPALRREAGSATRALVDTALSRVGLSAPTLMELGSPEALKQAVLQGVGIAWVSRLSVARELAAHELELVSVVGLSVPRVLSLVRRRDTALPPLAEPLLELIQSTTADKAQPY